MNLSIQVLKKLFLTLIILFLIACNSKGNYSAVEPLSKSSHHSTFIGADACKSCHAEAYKKWEGSHHDMAMKIADSSSVLGDFNNTTFTYKGVTSKFFKKDNDFYINTQDAEGNYVDFKIDYTYGVTPLQQYLVLFPNNEYQCLTTAWDSEKNKWFSLNNPDLEIIHGDWLDWTGGGLSWNTMCADCHSTDVKKNYDVNTDTYKTTFSEINVACEACHGPSSEHVSFYKEEQKGEAPEMYMNSSMTSFELVDKCARCHSRRAQLNNNFDYTGAFKDHYAPSMLSANLYEIDGQIFDEVYVYGSFIQSKMYHNGVSCKDCHDVHSLKLKKQGNDLCMSCHEPQYNTSSHHKHIDGTESAQCINCHMTGRTYMGNDFRRDHSFRIPRPDQSVKYGTPNACTGCHKDKSAQWAADFISKEYGGVRQDHFSDHLLKGYFEDPSAYEILMANRAYPEIARATAINHYSNQQLSLAQINNLKQYLKDSSALVRNETIALLEKIQFTDFSEDIEKLLKDSVALTRISAARYFSMTNQNVKDIEAFKNADKELQAAMDVTSDFASGQHQIGIYYQAKDNDVLAEKAYLRALAIDNYFNRSRMNLALLYYNQGLKEKSEALYLKVAELEPEFSLSYYMLGLLYSEMGDNAKSLAYLKIATDKNPPNQNAFYNYALKLQEAKQLEASIRVIERGLKIFPENERLLYLKLLAEANSGQIKKARTTCLKLIDLAPNNSSYKELLNRLRN